MTMENHHVFNLEIHLQMLVFDSIVRVFFRGCNFWIFFLKGIMSQNRLQ